MENTMGKRKNKRRSRPRIRRTLAVLLACAAVIIVLGVLSFLLLRSLGKGSLYRRADVQQMNMAGADTAEGKEWQTGWVSYQGRTYAYNEDILTLLLMGIDKKSDTRKVGEGTNGGQADALFLVVLNPHNREIRLIAINRNTMTPIDIYDENGELTDTVTAQIAVQHGFGDGMEESCEYQVRAVRNLLYQLPIHGYCAINMSAIATINDAVGGVDVIVPEDLTRADKAFREGASVHLEGRQAFLYLKYRDTEEFGSADGRLNRQKQYMAAFIKAARKKYTEDLSLPIKLYQAVSPAMVTDITVDEAAYLASTALDYSFDSGRLYTLKGTTVMGEEFEEFYADEEALYELLLEVFYEPVEAADPTEG